MKLNKILFSDALASVIGGSMTSCSESFLDEDLKTQYSTDRFKTQEGLDELVTGAYQKLKFKFNYIWAIECHNMGVDEFTDANNTMPASLSAICRNTIIRVAQLTIPAWEKVIF